MRFKKIDDVPLKLIGQTVKRVPTKKFIEHYESATQRQRGKSKAKSKKTTPKKKALKTRGEAKTSATKKRGAAARAKKN